jgi:uncharacterized protein involved in exopolysaccharide biosynthesis
MQPEKGSDLQPAGQRLAYVIPETAYGRPLGDEVSLRELWGVMWRGKWAIIAVTLLSATASVGYALMATEWFRAEVLLAPASDRASLQFGGQLGGLAAIAGVAPRGGDVAEAIATLKSRELARAFIEDEGLLTVFFADEWDAENKRWLRDGQGQGRDTRDAIEYFHANVLRVQQDRQTGLVTLAVEWTDPAFVADWAGKLVTRVNERLRDRALREAEANIAYLEAELANTGVVTLQQTIGRLLESELQKLMLARGNDEFAFKVVDPADAPKRRVRPRRTIIVVIGTMLGGMLAVFGVFAVHAIRAGPRERSTAHTS